MYPEGMANTMESPCKRTKCLQSMEYTRLSRINIH